MEEGGLGTSEARSPISEEKESARKSNPYKIKRGVSFKDKQPGESIHTVHHVESFKVYNASEEKGLSCLKCSLF
jgi:hypothetical protein